MKELDFVSLDVKADALWRSLNLKNKSVMGYTGKYQLTRKQKQFLHYAHHSFIELYSEIYVIYQAGNGPGLWARLCETINNYYQRKRVNQMLGSSVAETSGFWRGPLAIWLVLKDKKVKDEKQKSTEAYEKIKPLVEFFGSINDRDSIFMDFLLRFSIRFQNSLELLKNTDDGLGRLARFLSDAAIECIMENNVVVVSKGATSKVKVDFLMAQLIEHKKSKRELGLDNKGKILETESSSGGLLSGERKEWTIPGLLFKSTIETSIAMFYYKKPNHMYPAQLCTEIECQRSNFHSK